MSENTAVPLNAGVASAPRVTEGSGTAFSVLFSLSLCHFLNDMNQSLVPAIYPVLKTAYGLDFAQIGMITLAFQLTASLLQPLVGIVTDRRPMPFSLPIGMAFSLVGLLMLSMVRTYPMILVSAAMVGVGSSVFHPESSRMARTASGGRYGLAQSVFQLGGSSGTAVGPLLAAFVVVPRGQGSIAWFSLAALAAMVVLTNVSLWFLRHRQAPARRGARSVEGPAGLSRRRVMITFALLLVLLFSKNIYVVSLTSYYTFFLIHKFGVSVRTAQMMLFLYLGSVAIGTFLGGPIGDRIGRKPVIWVSILGTFPFALALPYAGLTATALLSVAIGLILASAFSAIVVYAQELLPGNVGMVAGMMFGFAFGMAGLGAAALGRVADAEGIDTVYKICSFLPLIGLLTAFLPNLDARR